MSGRYASYWNAFLFSFCNHQQKDLWLIYIDGDGIGVETLDSDSKPDCYIALCRIFHIAQTQTRIPTPYFCIGQESESESLLESVSDNVNEPLNNWVMSDECKITNL